MARVLMLTGDAGEAQEIYYAKYRLEEEGWEVVIAVPERAGAAEPLVFLSVIHDFEPGFATYTEKPGYRVQADASLASIDPTEFDGLVLPGGRAPEYLRNLTKTRDVVRHFIESGKPIGANCHGPLLLLASCPMKGRTMTAYPDLGIDVRSAGGNYEDSAVVVDGNLVTVRGWPDNGPWMREFVKLMKMRLSTPGRQ